MKLIEQGWLSYRNLYPKTLHPDAEREIRQAFYSGAVILFSTLMDVLEPGEEPTEADLEKMQSIQEELTIFGAELDRRAFGQPTNN